MGPLLFAVGDVQAGGKFLPPSVLGLAAARACVRSDDPEFDARFRRIFRDCLQPGEPAPGAPALAVSAAGDGPVVARVGPAGARWDGTAFPRLFPELDLVTMDAPAGWHAWARRGASAAEIAIAGGRLALDRALPWQIVVFHAFVDHLMRQQPGWHFFHGAALAMGESGVLLSGSKGAGKSTLSLALAARGHGFLGDEIAAIDASTGAMAPFPRAVSIRRGPQAAAVADFVERTRPETVTLSDGTDRIRLPVSSIFPEALPRPVRLAHAFFLGPAAQGAPPRRFDFSIADVGLLGPLHASLRGESGRDVVTFLNSFRHVRCWRLERAGSPDEMARLIEDIVEGKWDTAYRSGPSTSARFAGSRSG